MSGSFDPDKQSHLGLLRNFRHNKEVCNDKTMASSGNSTDDYEQLLLEIVNKFRPCPALITVVKRSRVHRHVAAVP